jgi:hypothetical protein
MVLIINANSKIVSITDETTVPKSSPAFLIGLVSNFPKVAPKALVVSDLPYSIFISDE